MKVLLKKMNHSQLLKQQQDIKICHKQTYITGGLRESFTHIKEFRVV